MFTTNGSRCLVPCEPDAVLLPPDADVEIVAVPATADARFFITVNIVRCYI